MKMIDDFHGEHFFLDNFSPYRVQYMSVDFPTSEHAFQAMKSTSPKMWAFFATLESPGIAKLIGQKVHLRPDWEDAKRRIMQEIVELKFRQNECLISRLLATGDAVLIEGNTWGDRTWGMVDGEGMNWLGEILMELRDKLKGE